MITRTEGITIYAQVFDRENRLTSVVAISGSTHLTTTFIYKGDSARVLQIKPNSSKVAYLGLVEIELK